MTSTIEPGLIVLHGNRLELLRDAVFDWLGRNPLEPLEEEVFLVQSNGAAEWLKMSLARATGVCAATRVELPGRFLWRAYRRVLGRAAVPAQSVLEKNALAWRLMRLLPERLDQAGFEPVAGFLQGNDLDRRLQLAQRLADLYDQYQVYRADWLAAWEAGRDVLTRPQGEETALPNDQRWQAALWRDILRELSDEQKSSTRSYVHRAFLRAMASGAAPAEPLPRRVVLFGTSYVSSQTLEALASLSRRVQVLLAIPNPCRFHWADIIEGREALHQLRQRHPASRSQSLATIPLEAMHLHAHPLLAAWGRQGRDFMRQLDAFDDAELAQLRFDLPRINLFDDGPGSTMLEQVQASIRDLVPLAEHPARVADAADRSIVFHIAHSAEREVEILHDQLLRLFAATGELALKPRDVVVMVPDIETFAPSIRAVFGQYDRNDARFIPFDIADLKSRGSNPLVVAVEWLLRLTEKRARLAEIRDLLDVPAIARRFDLDPGSLPGLFGWIAGAGVRWGLNESHRTRLGLAACGEQNSWLFGLRRMLLGFASGAEAAFAGIEPYDEIGGLEATTVGALADLFERLEAWWMLACADATPTEWARRARTLLETFVDPTDERERLTVAALQAALAAWLEACETAGFTERVPISVLREAWLSGIDGLDASRRFLTGGVTFCTLMPLRAVPFEVVCLLGMNDGDFPRQSRRSDFDLMALAGQQRAGDRSRRDDDRYLMLEALLSARRVLYVSWSGRSPRDNSVQPPSVLVSQLRDYLAAAWQGPDGSDALAQGDTARTTEHPLQPFSRRYFEGRELFTYAREWRAAHANANASDVSQAMPSVEATDVALTMQQLVRFLKNPVRQFFRARLDVVIDDEADAIDDDEAFVLDGLEQYSLLNELLRDPEAAVREGAEPSLEKRLRRIVGSGRLPMFELGARLADAMTETARPMLDHWVEFQRAYAEAAPKLPLRFEHRGLVIDDWLDGMRSDGAGRAWVELSASKLLDANGGVRTHKLISAWVRMLVAGACGYRAHGFLVGQDATLSVAPLETADARVALNELLTAWQEGMERPLPFAAKTALAFAEESKSAADIYDGGFKVEMAEGAEFCLARVFPDYEALTEDGRFDDYVHRLFEPMLRWTLSFVAIVSQGASLPVAHEVSLA